MHALPNGCRTEPVIQCRGISKVYLTRWWPREKTLALQNLDWYVYPGERWLVVGPNRAGKSTLLRLLVSFTRPTSGTLYRFGQPASNTATLLRVGYLAENAHLPGSWPVRALLHWSALLHGSSPTAAHQSVVRMLGHFQIHQYSHLRLSQLSRGLRQKVGLASVFVHDPDLIILDDPDTALDQHGRDQLCALLSAQAPQKAYIVSSVSAEPWRAWATHVLELNRGKVVSCGPLAQATCLLNLSLASSGTGHDHYA